MDIDIKELLQLADEKVLDKTGQNLDSLQKSILEGVLHHQNYREIFENNNGQYTYNYVKEEGAKLWKLLSDVFEKEGIKQSNVRSILDNIYNLDHSSLIINNEKNNKNSVIICRENQQYRDKKERRSPSSNSQNQSPKINQKDLPVLNYNYGRKTEINTLKTWLENQTKLITIYGLSGIGKTALILKLIPEIQENFDYIFYRRLDGIPKLIKLKDDLKLVFDQTQTKPLSELIDYLKNNRCLVILDDVHNIFKTGDLAGQYLSEFKDYSRFFQDMATLSHQSCLILISWEKPQQINQLEAENFNVKTLHLSGLGEDAKEILKEKGLKDEDQYLQLINLYQGNPSWLNIIALTIKDYYNSQFSRFLEEDELCLEGIETMLENHLERLSELEKKVIYWLAFQDQPLDIQQKPSDLVTKQTKFVQVIQSLTRRCLVEKILQENELKFQLNSVFKAYLINLLQK